MMASNLATGVVDSRFFSTKKVNILLDDSNYLLWRQQVLLAIKAHKLQGFLDLRTVLPPSIIPGDDGVLQENDEFIRFEQQDSAIASWLLSSVSQAVLPHLIGLDISAQIWNAIVSLYGSKTTSRLMFYRRALHSQRKGDIPMREFLMKIKFYCDNLASCGEVISEHEHVTVILNGLPCEYESIVSIIVASQVPYSLQSVSTMLIDAEARQQVTMADAPSPTNLVSQQSAKPANSNSGPAYRPAYRPSNIPITYSDSLGNPFAGNYVQQPQLSSSTTPQSHASLATPDTVADSAWYPNFGATHHLTHSTVSLGDNLFHTGPGKLYVGNGNALPVLCSGQSSLLTRTRPFYMKSLLYTPGITKNLLSMSKFTRDNQVMFECSPTRCKVRDLKTRETLLEGSVHSGLYKLHLKDTLSKVQPACAAHCLTVSTSIPLHVWHSRLGHPSKNTLLKALQRCNVSVDNNKELTACVVCYLGKEHKQPFSTLISQYNAPLQLVVANVWGPAPVYSNGF
ncbi:hypothetical protein Goarm_004936 [Gossypium armourianum]|uniref:GAG-pre-integrase domain-containing protein n=1 Tax=Gossypium armourianum TaxID=34283 RepID=A0A7J9JYI6_9ROSI|nr:hypothetical protein [Gossypium armourianum]